MRAFLIQSSFSRHPSTDIPDTFPRDVALTLVVNPLRRLPEIIPYTNNKWKKNAKFYSVAVSAITPCSDGDYAVLHTAAVLLDTITFSHTSDLGDMSIGMLSKIYM